jgi:hypothetical protein
MKRRAWYNFVIGVRGAAETKTRGDFSGPSGEAALHDTYQVVQPRQVFRNPDAQVYSMTPKQSPRYTQPYTVEDDPASSVWIKARRGIPRTSLRQPGPQVDRWVKAMRRGLSSDAPAQERLQASSMQRQVIVTQPAERSRALLGATKEVIAGSDHHIVEAQVKTIAHNFAKNSRYTTTHTFLTIERIIPS